MHSRGRIVSVCVCVVVAPQLTFLHLIFVGALPKLKKNGTSGKIIYMNKGDVYRDVNKEGREQKMPTPRQITPSIFVSFEIHSSCTHQDAIRFCALSIA